MMNHNVGGAASAAEDVAADQSLDLPKAWGAVLGFLTLGRSLHPVDWLFVEQEKFLDLGF